MKLLRAAGINTPIKPDVNIETEEGKELWETLVLEAYAFVAQGGFATLSEWLTLTDVEKQALMVARQQLDSERAAQIGLACSGPHGVAAVMERVDGGATSDRLNLAAAVAKAAAAIQGQEVRSDG